MQYAPSPLSPQFAQDSRRRLEALRATPRSLPAPQEELVDASPALPTSPLSEAGVGQETPQEDPHAFPVEAFRDAPQLASLSEADRGAPQDAESPGSAASDERVIAVARKSTRVSLEALRKQARACGVLLPRGITRDAAAALLEAALAPAPSAAVPC